MSTLQVSFIQTALHWENPEANLEMFAQLVKQIKPGVDLVILPEMFTTGFSMAPERLSEMEQGRSVKWMQSMAAAKKCVVTGSLIIEENGNYYNRLFWVLPDGSYQTYDKRHLFSLAGEENHYAQGQERLVVELKGFKIMPLICYDLRFPVWSRNNVDYDVLIYVANWPERRAFYWNQLLIARAIENQSYVIGVNRVGNDGNDIYHSGNSVCLDPLGQTIAQIGSGKEGVVNIILEKEKVVQVREKFRFLNDQDDFELNV